MRSIARRYRWSFQLLMSLAVAAPGVAWADESLPKVTVTASGPNRSMPVGTTFYLAGDAPKEVDRILPVFVRKSGTSLFSGRGHTCSDLQSKLGDLTVKEGPQALMDIGPGRIKAASVWSGEHDKDYDAFAPQAWARPDDVKDKTTFEILVPNDTKFFYTGASYCLFLYKRSLTVKADKETLKKILIDSVNDRRACVLTATDTHTCIAAAEQKRQDALNVALGELDPNARNAILVAIREFQPAAYKDLDKLRTDIQAIFTDWTPPLGSREPVAFARPIALPPRIPATGPDADPLGRAIVIMLGLRGDLRTHINPNPPDRLIYYTRDAAVRVDAVEVLTTHQLRVYSNTTRPSAAGAQLVTRGQNTVGDPPKTTTSDLTVPGSDVTLRDLLEFLNGRVRIESDYLRPQELLAELAPILSGPGKIKEEEAKKLRNTIARLTALDDTILHILLAPSPPPRKPGAAGAPGAGGVMDDTEDAVVANLGEWLRRSGALRGCDDAHLLQWGVLTNPKKSGCLQRGQEQGWPGFERGSSPLGHLVKKLVDFEQSRNKWADDAELQLTSTTVAATPLAEAFESRINYTQDTWVFSYLTPVTGYALPLGPEDKFGLAYIGVQLHFFPNPVDEPLWSNGFVADLPRAFALELAITPDNGPWGTDDRFAGWSGFPPVYAGLALHIVPYTSFSWGGTLLERRSSTLTQQKSETFWSQYVGFNVQANIPDLVMALKGRHATTTSSNVATK